MANDNVLKGNVKIDSLTATTGLTGNLTGTASGNIPNSDKGAAGGVAELDGNSLIPITRIPPAAIEKLFIVLNQAARLALTINDVQNGDTVKQSFDGLMYFVKDSSKLAPHPTPADAYEVYTAGTASSVAWSGVSDTPTTLSGYGITDYAAAAKTAAVGDAITDGTVDVAPSQNAVFDALALKAPLNNPTFTGTVSGITSSMVSLGNVDNTSDLNKPISTATSTALGNKIDKNAGITGAVKTKITYDAKGLVTAGTDATTADIASSIDKNYVTDAQQTLIAGATNANTASTLVKRDVSGNFSAGTITATLSGVSSATNSLSTTTLPVTINGAVAPSTGQVLMASSATTATWQTPPTSAPEFTVVASTTLFGYTTPHINTNGGTNTVQGINAGISAITGTANTLYGYDAGRLLTSGLNNTAIGQSALRGLISGSNNIAVGDMAMQVHATGNSNTAVGRFALGNSNGSNFNVAIGTSAGIALTSASENTMIGYNAGSTLTTANYNTAIGSGALQNSTGGRNIAIGRSAMQIANSAANCVVIGTDAGTAIDGTGESNNTLIGVSTNVTANNAGSIALGASAVTTASNQLMIGSVATPISETTYASGNTTIKTADNAGAVTGVLNIVTGTPGSTFNSGNLTLRTGGTTSANSGNLFVNTGSTTLTGTSGLIQIKTGGSQVSSGAWTAGTGNATNSGVTGAVTLTTGDSTESGSGTVTIKSGGASSSSFSATNSGSVTLGSGNSNYGASGDVLLQTGTAGTTRGTVHVAPELRLDSTTAAKYVGIKAPTMAATSAYTLTLPNAQGGSSQTLSNDGAGVLSWVTPATGDMTLSSIQTITGAKTFGAAGNVGKLVLAGSVSGISVLNAAAVAGTTLFTLPTTSGTLIGTGELGALATGILKNTTSTGVPTIAVAGTDYIGPGAAKTDTNIPMFSNIGTTITNSGLKFNGTNLTKTSAGIFGLGSDNLATATGNLSLFTGSTTDAISNCGGVYISTGSATGAGSNGGSINVTTGNATMGTAGDFNVTTGVGISGSGFITINSGGASGIMSGVVTLKSGISSAGGGSGTTIVGSGDVGSGIGNSGQVQITSGSTVAGISGDMVVVSGSSSGGGDTGYVIIASGTTNGVSGGISANTGNTTSGITGTITLISGDATASGGLSGQASLLTGSTTDGTSGTVNIKSGLSSGGGVTGDVTIAPGTTSTLANRGKVVVTRLAPLNTLTNVLASGSGNVDFVQNTFGTTHKSVMIYCTSTTGTASYTFLVAFTHTPMVISQSLAALVTAISTTSVTITGAGQSGFIELKGF